MRSVDRSNPADIAHAALMEAGRPDLAELVQFFYEDPDDLSAGMYLEPLDEVTDPADLALLERAEAIALAGLR